MKNKLIFGFITLFLVMIPNIISAENDLLFDAISFDKLEIHIDVSSSSELVGIIEAGREFQVIDQSINNLEETWYKIQIDNVIGWSKEGQWHPIVDSIEQHAIITQQDSPIQKDITPTSSLVERIEKDRIIDITKLIKDINGELWYKVDLGEKLGWINEKYVELNVEEFIALEQTKLAQTGMILSIDTPIYSGPMDSYPIITKLGLNESVNIIGLYQSPSNELWYQIDLGDIKGWITGDSISIDKQEEENMKPRVIPKTGLVIQENIVLRRGATSSYDHIMGLEKDQLVKIVDLFENSFDEVWYRVNINGIFGWIPASAVDTNQANQTVQTVQTRAITSIPVRRGATASYEIVSYMNTSGVYNVFGHFMNASNELWYRVTVGNHTGWVLASNVWDSKNTIKLTMKTIDNTTVRKGATTSYDTVSTLRANQNVNVISTFINSYGERWYRTEVNGQFGWIHASSVDSKEPLPIPDPNTTIPVRRGATTSYEIVSHMNTNGVYNVLGHFMNASNELWYRVTVGKQTGWVLASNVWNSKNTIKLTMKTINNTIVRKGATASYDTMSTLRANQNVNVISTFINSYGERWYRVEIDKDYGWIHASSVDEKVSIPFPDPHTRIPVRRGATTSYDIAYYVNEDVTYLVNGHFLNSNNELWYHLIVDNKTGWVLASDLKNVTFPNMITIADSVNVRRGASTHYDSVKLLDKNQEIKVVNIFLNSANEVWYNIELSPTLRGWVNSEFLEKVPDKKKTYYDITIQQALNIQMNQLQQTDKYRNEKAFIHSSSVNITQTGLITGDGVNLRGAPNLNSNVDVNVSRGTRVTIQEEVTGELHAGSTVWYKIRYNNKTLYVHSSLANPSALIATIKNDGVHVRAASSTSSHSYATLSKGTEVSIISRGGTWHEISYGAWRNPTRNDVYEYLNPENNDEFQHLVLSESIDVSASQLNNVLRGQGILSGLGQAFVDGGKQHSINQFYLIVHAFLETGNGTSRLANGIEVGKDTRGNLVLVTSSNRGSLKDIRTTYNMFGIGAADSDPVRLGAIRAYQEGWFTPSEAIKGGAKFIGDRYIYNTYNQNTLYKMRWNPANPGYPQYATDVGWAVKQAVRFREMYDMLTNPKMNFDIPVYKN